MRGASIALCISTMTKRDQVPATYDATTTAPLTFVMSPQTGSQNKSSFLLKRNTNGDSLKASKID